MLRETGEQLSPSIDDVASGSSAFRQDLGVEEPIPAVVDASLPFRSAPSAPDVPVAVGGLMFAVYMALIGALALATAGPGESKLVIAIAGLFVVAFFTVPVFIFAQEGKDGRRPTMDRFLASGLQTYTGKCSGKSALVQILIVPVLLTFAILLIALEIAFIG